jgi:hypothetical protein
VPDEVEIAGTTVNMTSDVVFNSDGFLSFSLQEHLTSNENTQSGSFEAHNTPLWAANFTARKIQEARDSRVASHNDYLEFFGERRAKTFLVSELLFVCNISPEN